MLRKIPVGPCEKVWSRPVIFGTYRRSVSLYDKGYDIYKIFTEKCVPFNVIEEGLSRLLRLKADLF